MRLAEEDYGVDDLLVSNDTLAFGAVGAGAGRFVHGAVRGVRRGAGGRGGGSVGWEAFCEE